MRIGRSERGFEVLTHEAYLPPHGDARLASQSSAINFDYDDSWRPGTSYLWVGEKHHLNREEALELAARLKAWAETGSLRLPADAPEGA